MRKHARPFKCQDSECPFSSLGFEAKTDLELHLAQAHDQNRHIASGTTQVGTNASSEEELKAILIDAVQEDDLSMTDGEVDAVRKFIFQLLLSAYKGRSSDAIIKNFLGQIPPKVVHGDDDEPVRTRIFTESI